MNLFGISLLILCCQNVMSLVRVDPLVNTNVGLIKGLRASDGDYSMFMGIPYAKVDYDKPFGDAIPYPEFEDTFEAYDDSAMCPQYYRWYNNTIVGSLDCLHLNVYVPTSTENRLPVMVFIHGGAFNAGLAARFHHSPRFLMKHDVIVVIINYRIDVYGFMCLDIPEAPGNEGLKDQYIALQWVKNNIEAFGGDSNKITLFGSSAGAHSIDFHLLSSKDILYNNVILQSGNSLSATVLYEPDKEAALKLASYLGFETDNTIDAIQFLSKTDTNIVIAAVLALNIFFKPCVESEIDGIETFISSDWVTAKIPKVKDIPVMIGFCEHENVRTHLYKDSEYYENLDIITDFFERTFQYNGEQLNEMKGMASHYYFGDEEFSEKVQWDIGRLDSDFTYIHPIQRTISKYIESGAGNIYYFMFSYIGGRNAIVTEDDQKQSCCAAHVDDLVYLLDTELRPELTTMDEVVMERITKMWTNFAKYSDPTPSTSELLPIKWYPVSEDKLYYMRIGQDLTLESRPHQERMAFWDLFYKYYKN